MWNAFEIVIILILMDFYFLGLKPFNRPLTFHIRLFSVAASCFNAT